MGLGAAYIGNGGFSTPVALDRQLVKTLFSGQHGLLYTGAFNMSPSGTDYAIAVAAGAAHLVGNNHATQGGYFVSDPEPAVVPWAPPSVSPRVDSLLLLVADGQYGTVTTTQGPQWIIAQGAPGGSPVARTDGEISSLYAQPGSWLRIGDVLVNPGDTSFVTGDITMRAAQGIAAPQESINLADYTPASTTTVTWLDIPSGTLAPITVIVPPSGKVEVTVAADLYNDSTSSSTMRMSYRVSGTAMTNNTDAFQFARNILGAGAGSGGGRTSVLTGMVPGTTLTVTPTFRQSSTGGANRKLAVASLRVVPLVR